MRFLGVSWASFFVLFFTVSCSSTVKENFHSYQKVLLESLPLQSDIYMNGEFLGKTPIVLSLRSDISHEIHFQKEGFKPTISYLDPIYKHEKKPYVQFGLAKDLGYYYQLSKNHVIAELHWEHLPLTVGTSPFNTMSNLIAKADNALSLKNLTEEEHRIIISQIIKVFSSK